MNTQAKKLGVKKLSGFALVATIAVMTLLMVVTLGLISLATIDARQANNFGHQARAQANARLAIMIALGELQKHAGPDQRVTARAAILENPAGTTQISNRNWLGIWKTTYEDNSGVDWPLIGKVSTGGSGPYGTPGAYSDLRHTGGSDLTNGEWKITQLQTWLVSTRSTTAAVATALDESDDHVIEILGEGTLGVSPTTANQVLVEKVTVEGNGAYAWYISDNNQKASIDPIAEVTSVEAALEASPRGNPALVQAPVYKNFTERALDNTGKIITYSTAGLAQGTAVNDALKQDYHHLTTYAPGLFTDTLLGGLRRDLTPLLLSNKNDLSVDFASQGSFATTPYNFSSTYPIIPGPDHGVLGPSFGALRNWAQHMHTPLTSAETTFASTSDIRMRPTTNWPHGISDGATFDAAKWPESAPKIHPIMTEARWHYYFSRHASNQLRTHIIPRVCLWNPYNRPLTISNLTVLMPNPFYNYNHVMHFMFYIPYVENTLQDKADNTNFYNSWEKKVTRTGYAGGPAFKMRPDSYLFPLTRYLGFTLAGTTLAPGECHVFFPANTSSVPTETSGVTTIRQYQIDDVSKNVLSSSSSENGYTWEHFYFDVVTTTYSIQSIITDDWEVIPASDLNRLDFSKIEDYQPEHWMTSNVESFPFVLKAGECSSLAGLADNKANPTLQLINNGAGGVKGTTSFNYKGLIWRSANQEEETFGFLPTFEGDEERKVARTHQVGAKLLWLNESYTEGSDSPYRHNKWESDHMAYNVCPIANWNIRAQLTTRSPASQCANMTYLHSAGPWLNQFHPYAPQDDLPSLNALGTSYTKNPFFQANPPLPIHQNVILFDFPSPTYGVLSLAKLRHAMLSPYSWNPSYIVGHSLRDMHAPSERTAHAVAVQNYSSTPTFPTRWDNLLGAFKANDAHGAYATLSDSQGLMQIGSDAVTRDVGGTDLSSQKEVLAYDIAYEVNHNLWDRYFISGMPLNTTTTAFSYDPDNNQPLWNSRYQFNFDSKASLAAVISEVSSSEGVNTAFWKNGQYLKNKAAFNINSTSVEAWTTFLSGTLGIDRPLETGVLTGDVLSFVRHRNPLSAGATADAEPEEAAWWIGARQFTNDEVITLAENIVKEVKERGPFISIADFVNRRLVDEQDLTSRMGTIDAAIKTAGLNTTFLSNSEYLSTNVNSGGDASDNNHPDFKNSYKYDASTAQPESQAWGLPGFLTQSDILEPLAPSLTVRGDTFTIRAYGESTEGGQVKATAWIEVVVERTPHYVNSKVKNPTALDANFASDRATLLDYATGDYDRGDLSDINQKFGRKFVIKSFRWLSPDEI